MQMWLRNLAPVFAGSGRSLASISSSPQSHDLVDLLMVRNGLGGANSTWSGVGSEDAEMEAALVEAAAERWRRHGKPTAAAFVGAAMIVAIVQVRLRGYYFIHAHSLNFILNRIPPRPHPPQFM
jgi:hypothetical protein